MLFFINKKSTQAADNDNPAPNINGALAPKYVHSVPAIKLAGSKATPIIVACKPSIVPLSSNGEISAINALSTPAIIAVYTPYSINIPTITVLLIANANPR